MLLKITSRRKTSESTVSFAAEKREEGCHELDSTAVRERELGIINIILRAFKLHTFNFIHICSHLKTILKLNVKIKKIFFY